MKAFYYLSSAVINRLNFHHGVFSTCDSNHCRLLVNHDDYSILTKLPAQSTSVVTNIRHPVDRIFSAYEFSVEVAARFLSQKLRRKPRVTKTAKNMGASTLNIWPWSLLVPWMRDDLFTRVCHC